MTIVPFPSDYEPSVLAERPDGISGAAPDPGSDLRELLKSDENFLSMLEAIHYLSFPGC